ncbi:MAG: choice-of-anchor J domain-containing protein, partial [Bacteroidetes bacterium]|nr:choice-of-anchor J domain-containing protein [Bacteroidota bacterium]
MSKISVWIFVLASVWSFSRADVLVNQDFSAGNPPSGWTNTVIQGTQGWIFANTLAFGSNGRYAQFDDQGLGPAVSPNEAALVSPTVSFIGRTSAVLSFDQYFPGVENTGAFVELSIDGGTTWTTLVNYELVTQGSLASPAFTRIDISAQAAGQANVRVRFRYTDGGVAGLYWIVDNVKLFADPDVGITGLVAPAYLTCSSTYSATETVTVTLTNFSAEAANLTNLPITVAVTGPNSANLTGTYTGIIPAGGSISYNMPTTMNMSIGGVYTFVASAGLGTDGYLDNNSFTTSRASRVNVYPFSENFNNSDGGWTLTAGTGGQTWQWGALPAGYAGFTGADASQGNAWRTITFANNGSSPHIVSPFFDFSTVAAGSNLALAMDFKMKIGNILNCCWGSRVVVQYELNGNGSWTDLGNNEEPGWYQPTHSGWTTGWGAPGLSGTALTATVPAWRRANTDLCGLIGQTCVRFRVWLHVAWIPNGVPAEFALDNFQIVTDGPDVGISSILAPQDSPSGSCTYNTNTIHTIRVYNKRCTPISNIPVEAKIVGPLGTQTLNETIPGPINGSDFIDYTFINGMDLSAVGSYSITTYTQLNTDVMLRGDTARRSVTVSTPFVNTFPYEADFDASDFGWLPVNVSGSGTNAWSRSASLPANYAGFSG